MLPWAVHDKRAYVHTCMRACVHAPVSVRVRVRVRVYARARRAFYTPYSVMH